MSDNNNRNIRLVKAGGRRVTRTAAEYEKNNKRISDMPRPETKLQRRVRYQKRQKQRRLKMQRIRALIILILAIITVTVILFMTPVFNIRSVTVEGNTIVTADEFQEMLKPLVGENLFRTGSGKIEKMLKVNPYIDRVSVQKKAIPPAVHVTVSEYVPAAVLRAEGKTLLVSSHLNVLSDSGDTGAAVPAVTGFSVSEGEVGGIVKSDETEKRDIVLTALTTLEKTGVLDKVIEIDISDTTNITMNYDNRLTVKCGTQLDLERKLRLFRETVMNNYFADNVRGTIEFTESGKAVYTP